MLFAYASAICSTSIDMEQLIVTKLKTILNKALSNCQTFEKHTIMDETKELLLDKINSLCAFQQYALDDSIVSSCFTFQDFMRINYTLIPLMEPLSAKIVEKIVAKAKLRDD
jgi:hypothetical protein